jgi:hypothetical protein
MKCTRCYTEFSETSATSACPVCGATSGGMFRVKHQPLPPVINKIPFEDPLYDNKPFIALVDTLRECIFNPKLFFTKITSGQSKWHPLIFSLAVGGIGAVASFLWGNLIPDPFETFKQNAFSESISENTSINTLISAPVLLVITIFLLSFYFQVVLKVFKKSKATFIMMFRIVCYSEATSLFMVIPFIGDTISFFFGIYLTLTGIKIVHNISRTRFLLMSLLAPLVLIFIFVFFLLIILIAFASFAGSSIKDLLPFLNF